MLGISSKIGTLQPPPKMTLKIFLVAILSDAEVDERAGETDKDPYTKHPNNNPCPKQQPLRYAFH